MSLCPTGFNKVRQHGCSATWKVRRGKKKKERKGKTGKKEEKKGGKKESRNISEVGRRKGNKERGKPGM